MLDIIALQSSVITYNLFKSIAVSTIYQVIAL
jgi:hypothetical protein